MHHDDGLIAVLQMESTVEAVCCGFGQTTLLNLLEIDGMFAIMACFDYRGKHYHLPLIPEMPIPGGATALDAAKLVIMQPDPVLARVQKAFTDEPESARRGWLAEHNGEAR